MLDEVFTGYGRTGPMWASEHAEVVPDIMCIAKGFTAGMLPMAATLATERLFDGFRGADERALYYGHTYCGHALGAAAVRHQGLCGQPRLVPDQLWRLGDLDATVLNGYPGSLAATSSSVTIPASRCSRT